MNLTFSLLPTSIDSIHILLILLVLVLLVVIRAAKSANTTKEIHSSSSTEESTIIVASQPYQEAQVQPETSPMAALQLLSLLQQEARFVDFLQEDLTHFSDEEVGAVSRVVHQGSKKVLNQYLSIKPIADQPEESSITLDKGYNASTFRITGNVTGEPPFNGTIIHRGWKVESVHLPQIAKEYDPSIIMPAEVEL
jgi:hypothetical protein